MQFVITLVARLRRLADALEARYVPLAQRPRTWVSRDADAAAVGHTTVAPGGANTAAQWYYTSVSGEEYRR